MDVKFLVRVGCVTFNQALYIEDAMNGFCIQETNFPFVCTIMDDASTDGEPEVIKKYLKKHFDLDNKNIVRNEETDDYVLTFAQHMINKNCYFAVLFLKYNHYSIKKSKVPYIQEWQNQVKYLAFCEGDDFWTHPNKLQIQINHLNLHPECSANFGNFVVHDQKEGIIHKIKYAKKTYGISDVMAGLMPGLQNICMRSNVNLVAISSKSNGDMICYYRCGISGKLSYIDEDFAVYRKTGNGIATKRSSTEHLKAIFCEEYKFHKELGFSYNSELAKYQTRVLYNHLKKNNAVCACIRFIRLYHIPNKFGCLYYFIYLLRYIWLDVLKTIMRRRHYYYI